MYSSVFNLIFLKIAEGGSRARIIKQFDVDFALKILAAQTNQLSKLRFTLDFSSIFLIFYRAYGKMPSLEIFVDEDKMKRLLDIVNTVATSTVPPAKPSLESKRESMAKRRKTFRKTLQMNLENLATSPLPSLISPRNTRKKEEEEKKMIEAGFEILQISVLASRKVGDGHEYSPFLSIAAKGISTSLSNSNQQTEVTLKLQEFIVEDRVTETTDPILSSLDSGAGEELIYISYTGIPEDSVTFTGIQHDIKARFNSLQMNIERPVILACMKYGLDISNSLAPKPATPEESKALEEEEALSRTEDLPIIPPEMDRPPDDILMVKVFEVYLFSFCLFLFFSWKWK